jgi:hypothetical protein
LPFARADLVLAESLILGERDYIPAEDNVNGGWCLDLA